MKVSSFLTSALLTLILATGVAAEKATFILDWIIIGSHAGYFAALDKGFFKDEGFDMTIIPGRGSGKAVKIVGLGKTDFGYADLGAMIIGRAKGSMSRMVGMIIGKAPYVLYSLEPTGIRKPKDLEGKTIGSTSWSALNVLFPAYAKINNIDTSKVKWVNMNTGLLIPSLLSGAVDVTAHYTGSGPMIEASAAKQGKKAVPLYHRDWGFNIYSNGLLVRDDTVAKKPRQVRRFLAAAYKGILWAMQNQDEAITILSKHNQALNPELAKKSWQVTLKEILTEESRKHGLGYMLAEKVRATRNLAVKYRKLKKIPPLDEIYTNEFLPGIKPPKMN